MNSSVRYAFLDSGIGGLPYLSYFHEKAPNEQAVYIADTEHFPYGEKTREEVIRAACGITERIIERFRPRVIVIACNTISVAALDILRKTFPVPFVGTVPAVKRAAERSVKKNIGIIATERTIQDPYVTNLIKTYAADCRITLRGDASLVSAIENGLITADAQEKKAAVEPAVMQFKQAGADTIVLACTHFLHLADVFVECAAPEMEIVDSREGVIKQTLRLAPPQNAESGKNHCYVTGIPSDRVARLYNGYCRLFNLQWCGSLECKD